MTPQELKNSILQLAIQGKLVEQRPEEGTAEDLYRQIQAEKQALIKAGKIKKEKAFRKITEDEMPFDIPESWIWVRLGDCTSYAYTKEKVVAAKIDPDDWSLDLEDIEKDTGRIVNFCKAGERSITGDKVVFHQGQILYSKLRPYLKKILVAPKDGICTPELVPFVAFGGIDPHFLVSVLKAPHVDYVINSVTYGVKMPRVGTETMVNLLVPLPPIAEQERIVAKFEELLPLIDRYEQAWSKLEDFNKRFPGDMQKSILQMAVQGKLVPQDVSEGTGEELYRQIHAEKQKLIKAGKIKKEKPLPEIAEDEIPFEIPDSWKWVRFQNITQAIGDGLHGTPVFSGFQTPFPFINGNNLEQKKIVIKPDTKFVDKAEYEKYCISLSSRAVLLSINGTIGNIAYYNDETIVLGKSACYIDPLSPVIREYVELFLRTNFFLDYSASKATKTTISNLGLKAIRNCPVPLPPLAEQKRIVVKLAELLPLCERLK